MEAYKEKLYAALERIEAEPVCMRTVEQATAVLDLLCTIRKMEEHKDGTQHFDRKTAMRWAERMENEDGTTGAHWTMAQTETVRKSSDREYPPCVWWAAMNMCYSDYYGVAVKHGVNKPEFYADLADAFLSDKDAGGAEEKISAYYRCIAS